MRNQKIISVVVGVIVIIAAVVAAVPRKASVGGKTRNAGVQNEGGAVKAGVVLTRVVPEPPVSVPQQQNSGASQSYAIAQVTSHDTPSNCWTAVNGNVYDLTQWISQHPGGDQSIMSMCGIDASDAFNQQHGGQRRPERMLDSFRIGTLIQ